MATETQSEIASIDIANDELIEVLAKASADMDATLVVIGDGPRRMAVPESASYGDADIEFDARELVSAEGDLFDSIIIDGDEVELNIV